MAGADPTILDQAAQWLKDGRRVALATVIETWGSAPQPVGSQLAIDAEGNFIGSVSGDRGRRANYVYGAAKAFVDRYLEGMQHRFAGTRVNIVLIKPGPTDTPMAAHLKAQGRRLASVEDVARLSVAAIDRGRPVAYAPRSWRWIMLVIRHIPRFLFNRLSI